MHSSPVLILVLIAPFHICYWKPSLTNSWFWNIGNSVIRNGFIKNADIWDIDTNNEPTDPEFLHQHGINVICYVNVGSLENDPSFRPDYYEFPNTTIGLPYPGWPEHFIDTRSPIVRGIMQRRFANLSLLNCDGIEPDNIDSYTFKTGFPLTASTARDYIMWIANTVQAMGMSVGLKNGDDLIAQYPDIVTNTDFGVVENCVALKNCGGYKAYSDNGKALLGCDYVAGSSSCSPTVKSDPTSLNATCSAYLSFNFSGIIRDCDLSTGASGSFSYVCPAPGDKDLKMISTQGSAGVMKSTGACTIQSTVSSISLASTFSSVKTSYPTKTIVRLIQSTLSSDYISSVTSVNAMKSTSACTVQSTVSSISLVNTFSSVSPTTTNFDNNAGISALVDNVIIWGSITATSLFLSIAIFIMMRKRSKKPLASSGQELNRTDA